MYALPYAEHTPNHVLDAAFAMQLHLCVHVVIKYYTRFSWLPRHIETLFRLLSGCNGKQKKNQ